MIAGAEGRRQRDAAIRAAFADPAGLHHEAVAEAELDIDYAGSPIVMGEGSDALWPGQRLPDWIDCVAAASGAGPLHRHADRRGHTAFILGGTATGAAVQEVRRAVAPLVDGAVIEAVMTVAADADDAAVDASLTPAMAERLGLGAVTLLVVRPDGHIGLRAAANHAATLEAYIGLIRSGRG